MFAQNKKQQTQATGPRWLSQGTDPFTHRGIVVNPAAVCSMRSGALLGAGLPGIHQWRGVEKRRPPQCRSIRRATSRTHQSRVARGRDAIQARISLSSHRTARCPTRMGLGKVPARIMR